MPAVETVPVVAAAPVIEVVLEPEAADVPLESTSVPSASVDVPPAAPYEAAIDANGVEPGDQHGDGLPHKPLPPVEQPAPDGTVVLLLDEPDPDLEPEAPFVDPQDAEAGGRGRDRKRSEATVNSVTMAPRRKVLTGAALLLVVALIAAAAVTFGRKSAAAASPYSWDNLPSPLTSLPSKRWTYDLQGSRLADAISNDSTVFTATDDGTVSRLAAHDARTGAVQWRVDLPSDARVQRLVLAQDDLVAVSSVDTSLRFSMIRISNGTTRWTAVVGGRYAAVLPGTDRILILSGSQTQSYDRAAAYDRRTGEQIWARNSPVGQLDGDRVIVVEDRDVVAVDIESGNERQRWTELVTDGNARQPVTVGGSAAVLAGDAVLVDSPGTAPPTSVAPGIGQPVTVLPTGDHLLTVVSTQGIAAVDMSNRQVAWARDLAARAIGRANGHLVLLGTYGQPGNTLVVVNAANGREEGFQRFDDIVPRRPLTMRSGYLADGAAYLITTDGGIRGVALPTLKPLWNLDPEALGGQARDVRATTAGLLVISAVGHIALFR